MPQIRVWGPSSSSARNKKTGKVNHYWQLKWKTPEGVIRTKNLGNKETLSQAKARAMCIDFAARLQRDPLANARTDLTLGELVEARKAGYRSAAKATLHQERMTTDRLLQFFTPKARAGAITRHRASDWEAWLSTRPGRSGEDATVSDTTVRKHAALAKRLFAWAMKSGLVSSNPFEHLKSTPPKVDKDVPYMTPATFARLVDFSGVGAKQHPVFLCLCRYAGLRRGEAIALQWTHIDFERHRINIPAPRSRVKSTKKWSRSMPIRSELFTVLQAAFDAAPQGSLGPCDKLSYGNVARNTKAAAKRAGIVLAGDPHHSLRASAERDWINLGFPEAEVVRWMGHSQGVARKHYLRDDDLQMARAAGLAPSELEQTRTEIEALRRELAKVKTSQPDSQPNKVAPDSHT